jgi:acyl carrier protein
LGDSAKPLPGIEEIIAEITRGLGAETTVPVTPGTDLFADLALDSLTLTSLVVSLEDHYRIRLQETDAGEIRTVADLAALVRRRIEEQS